MACGGFGEHVMDYLNRIGSQVRVLPIALPDDYVEHGNVELLRKEVGIDPETIEKKILASYSRNIGETMKERLDVLLVKRNLAASREKAKAIIMSGNVYVKGQKEDKAGAMFADTAAIEVRGNTLPYVSRGGLKLEKAMSHFDISTGRKGLYGCRLVHRRFYRLYAPERSSQGICGGCGTWTAGLEAASGFQSEYCMEKTNIRYVTSRADPGACGVFFH